MTVAQISAQATAGHTSTQRIATGRSCSVNLIKGQHELFIQVSARSKIQYTVCALCNLSRVSLRLEAPPVRSACVRPVSCDLCLVPFFELFTTLVSTDCLRAATHTQRCAPQNRDHLDLRAWSELRRTNATPKDAPRQSPERHRRLRRYISIVVHAHDIYMGHALMAPGRAQQTESQLYLYPGSI